MFSIEDGFRNAATAASLHGTTFFSGEWGWFGDPAVDQANIERYAAAEDRHRIGGTWWQWEQACGDPHAVGVRGNRPSCAGHSPFSDGLVTRPRANTMVLDRAYPRAVPGQLEHIGANVATGSLTVRGRANHGRRRPGGPLGAGDGARRRDLRRQRRWIVGAAGAGRPPCLGQPCEIGRLRVEDQLSAGSSLTSSPTLISPASATSA